MSHPAPGRRRRGGHPVLARGPGRRRHARQQTSYAGPPVGAAEAAPTRHRATTGDGATDGQRDPGDKAPVAQPPARRRGVGVGSWSRSSAGWCCSGWQLGTTAFRRDRDPDRRPRAPPTTDGQQNPAAARRTWPSTAAGDFDPDGDGSEHPDEVELAYDGKPATAWSTATYQGSPKLGNLKPGVGMWVDLGDVKTVGAVKLQLVGSGSDVSLYVPNQPDAAAPPEHPVRLAEDRQPQSGGRRLGGP